MDKWPLLINIATQVQTGQLKATSLVNHSLETMQAHKNFQAIISVPKERALQRAAAIDERVGRGEKIGRLAGVPFIAKDNFLTLSGKTTAAANMLKNFEAPYQATAIEKLEAEGAICVAKSNLDAWAHGSSTENSDFFVTKNPYDESRVPGGSSGGSAAAVALKMAPFAVGTDTGSSVRLPASFCGVVGLKPTYGLVSRSGVVAMASSLDVIGPIANTVEDIALLLDVISGRDELDSTTIERDQESYSTLDTDLNNKKFGVIKEYMSDDVDSGVKNQIQAAIHRLENKGAQIIEVSLPSIPLSLAAYYIICPAEVSSNLARYDGQRYGYSAPEAKNLEESYSMSREKGFGAEAKRRIMIGTYVLSSGYYEAYYKKAQTVRSKLINEFNEVFHELDFLIGPVAPTPAFKIGERSKDPLQMYLADVMMVASNLTGIPSISVPAGKSQGLPVGLQIIAPQRKDRALLGVAKAFMEIPS